MKLIMVLALLISGCTQVVPSQIETSRDESPEVIISGLKVPWAIDFLPDGTMVFTERHGKVSHFDWNSTKTIAELEVRQESESGLHGIAVDPDFSSSRQIFLYYTAQDGFNRVSAFTFNGERLAEERIIVESIPSARIHDGGRIKFGPDGKLYIATGDSAEPSSSQDLDSLAGKILRVNKDGTIPGDNPFGTAVWSYGHRNPQGLAWLGSQLYAAEHGQSSNDEVNLIIKGSNYGWPSECTDEGDFESPVRCFTEFTMAPGGIAFSGSDLYIAGLRGSQLRKLAIEDGEVVLEAAVISDAGRIRDVVYHDGHIYYSTSNHDGRGVPQEGDDKISRIRVG